MPMQRRLPKVGFKNFFRDPYFPVNVGSINERFEAGTVTVDDLQKAGLVPRRIARVKVLGTGEVTKKLVVRVTAFSGSAKEKLEKSGGAAEVVEG
jgi:large subunit ribosomal protein L15